MKKIAIGITLFLALFIQPASADWAYRFVVYSGNLYLVTNQTVDPGEIGAKIGAVTKYSDKEGTYSGNFSNTFPQGTAYYSIQGMNMDMEIAVQKGKNAFIRTIYKGHYAGSSTQSQPDTAIFSKSTKVSTYRAWIYTAGMIALAGTFTSYHLLRKTHSRYKDWSDHPSDDSTKAP